MSHNVKAITEGRDWQEALAHLKCRRTNNTVHWRVHVLLLLSALHLTSPLSACARSRTDVALYWPVEFSSMTTVAHRREVRLCANLCTRPLRWWAAYSHRLTICGCLIWAWNCSNFAQSYASSSCAVYCIQQLTWISSISRKKRIGSKHFVSLNWTKCYDYTFVILHWAN